MTHLCCTAARAARSCPWIVWCRLAGQTWWASGTSRQEEANNRWYLHAQYRISLSLSRSLSLSLYVALLESGNKYITQSIYIYIYTTHVDCMASMVQCSWPAMFSGLRVSGQKQRRMSRACLKPSSKPRSLEASLAPVVVCEELRQKPEPEEGKTTKHLEFNIQQLPGVNWRTAARSVKTGKTGPHGDMGRFGRLGNELRAGRPGREEKVVRKVVGT